MGVYGTFTNVDEYCLDLIPFDSDVLSMEMENSFRVGTCTDFVNLQSFCKIVEILVFIFKMNVMS